MQRLLYIILICLPSGSLWGQDNTIRVFDSSSIVTPKKINKRTSLKPTGDFDQRFSFIAENKNVSIWGYRIGVMVNDKYKVGIGGYTLNAVFDSSSINNNSNNLQQVKQRLNFGSVYFEPFLFRRKRWEMSLLFELGYGTANIDSTLITRINGVDPRTIFTKRQDQIDFIPMSMGLSVNFIIPDMKGFHWLTYFGLNGMIGMRKVWIDRNYRQNYDGMYWSIGTAIFIDRIFTDISKKRRIKKEQAY